MRKCRMREGVGGRAEKGPPDPHAGGDAAVHQDPGTGGRGAAPFHRPHGAGVAGVVAPK